MTNNQAQDLNTESRRLCSECVREAFLRAEVEKRGQSGVCFYCGGEGRIFSLGEMADEIERAFEEHFYRTPMEPSPYDYAMMEVRDWYRDGDLVADVIAESAGITPEPAEDIRKVLAKRHFDWELAKMGEEILLTNLRSTPRRSRTTLNLLPVGCILSTVSRLRPGISAVLHRQH